MNGFYGQKAWRGNTPLDMLSTEAKRRGIITHDVHPDKFPETSLLAHSLPVPDTLDDLYRTERLVGDR
jgi:hypothetical protein